MATSKPGRNKSATGKPAKAREAAKAIHINNEGKASPPDKKINNRETIIFKIKGTKKAATIVFLGSAVHEFKGKAAGKVTVSAGRPSARLSPKKRNVTVDYEIRLGPRKTGPFSIQVGRGALNITIGPNGDPDIDDASIPDGGSVIFTNHSGRPAQIEFTGDKALYDGANPVTSPQNIAINGHLGPLTGKGKKKKVDYHIDLKADAEVLASVEMLTATSGAARGNGTIKVGQT